MFVDRQSSNKVTCKGRKPSSNAFPDLTNPASNKDAETEFK